MREFISILLLAIASTIAVESNKILLDKGVDISASLIVSVVISVLFFEVANFLLTKVPMKLRFFRRFLDPKAKFEGLYIETFDKLPERPVSIGAVDYNSESKQYIYTGRAFDKEGNLRAQWNAFDVFVEPGKNIVRHFFTGEILDQTSEDVRGYGILDFNTKIGFFLDSGTDLKKHHFAFRKLNIQDFRKYTGKFRRPNQSVWGKMAKAYFKEMNVT